MTPPRPLYEEPGHITPSLRLLLDLGRSRHHSVIEPDSIDGDAGESSVVLQSTCDESLREEEAGDPEDGRNPLGVPVLDEFEPLKKIGLGTFDRICFDASSITSS